MISAVVYGLILMQRIRSLLMKMIVQSIIFVVCFIPTAISGHKYEKVLLTEVQAITLHKNAYTTGRRAPPVPQLKCVGGSAADSRFHPAIAQCYNRGSYGDNVQWECKADLDNVVKFGKINVYCEGYNYPDDPYILKDSCGLEYHLEYVESYKSEEEILGQKYYKKPSKRGDMGENLVVFLIIGVAIAIVYFTCIRSTPTAEDGSQPRGGGGRPPFDGPPPPYDDDRPSAPPGGPPPPYGFRPENFPKQGAGTGTYQRHGYQQQQQSANLGGAGVGGANQGPGFWTGMGAGGILGYLFGNSGSGRSGYGSDYASYRPSYTERRRSDHTSSGWFGSSGPSTSGAGSSGTGSRTASGFGETRRR